MYLSITERKCAECGKTKPIDAFRRGGMFLSMTCKPCMWLAHVLAPLKFFTHTDAPKKLNKAKMIRLPKVVVRFPTITFPKIRARRTPEELKASKQQDKRNRRALEKNAEGKITVREWLALCEKYGKCLCCGRSDVKLTLDHVKPLSIGGANLISNAQPLCVSCNSRKGTKYIDYRPTHHFNVMANNNTYIE